MAFNTESSEFSIMSFASTECSVVVIWAVCYKCSSGGSQTCVRWLPYVSCNSYPCLSLHLVLQFFEWIKLVVILPLLLVLVLIVGLVVWCGRSVVLQSLNKWAISSHSRCCRCRSTGRRDIRISCCHWVGICRWCTHTWVTASPTIPIRSWISTCTTTSSRAFLCMAWQQHRVERWHNGQFWEHEWKM